jgi:hypothetical protein
MIAADGADSHAGSTPKNKSAEGLGADRKKHQEEISGLGSVLVLTAHHYFALSDRSK